MPIISVKIDVVEALDEKLIEMCEKETAILIQDGSVFSNIFPKAMDRSSVFRKKYGIVLKPGPLLFAKIAEMSLFFDYRGGYKRGEVQITEENILLINKICPEIRDIMSMRNSGNFDKKFVACLEK